MMPVGQASTQEPQPVQALRLLLDTPGGRMPGPRAVRPCRNLRRLRLGGWSITELQCMPLGGPGGPKTICHIHTRKP